MNPTPFLEKMYVAAVIKAHYWPLAWGAAGKLPEHRHPVNNYRLFKRAEVEKLLRQLEKPLSVTTHKLRRPK